MDKIRIVVECSELNESQKADYLKENGIDEAMLKTYQQEAASLVGVSVNPEPAKPKTRCEILIKELQDENENVRRDAAKELGTMRHKATEATDVLINSMLEDSIDFVRTWSAWALTRINPRNEKVIEGFLQSLSGDEKAVHARNWSVVGLSVSESDHAKKQLIKILHNGDSFARFSAIQVLTNMNVESSEFVEGLKIAIDSDNSTLSDLAQEELSKLQSED